MVSRKGAMGMEEKTVNLKKTFLILVFTFALFWFGWYLIQGFVPKTKEILIFDGVKWILPFGLSRWWDVLFGPIIIAISVWLFKNGWSIEKGKFEQPYFDLGLGMGFSMNSVLAILFIANYGLVLGLQFFIGIALLGSFVSCLSEDIYSAFSFSAAYCFAFGCFGLGLFFGFFVAFLIAVAVLIICLIGIVAAVSLKIVKSWILHPIYPFLF